MTIFEPTENLTEFDAFVEENGGSILQTSKGAENKPEWQSHFIVGRRDGKVVLTCLLLERKIARFITVGYIPLGFVCDYGDPKLLRDALAFVGDYTQKHFIDVCFVDPTVPYLIEGEEQAAGIALQKNMVEFGLIKTKGSRPYIQPDTTFVIDLYDEGKEKNIEELISGFEKGIKYSIKNAEVRGLGYKSYLYSDIQKDPAIFDEFIQIMSQTMGRLGSMTRGATYFKNLLKNFEPYAYLNMVYYDAVADRMKNEENEAALKRLSTETESKAFKELEIKISSYQKRVAELEKNNIDIKKADKIYLAGSITTLFGDTADCLYGGSKNLLRNLARPSHFLNYKRIEDSVRHHLKYHDLARIYLASHDQKDENYGLYLFKKSFGAKEIKYVGEYAFVNNRFAYWLLVRVSPAIRSFVGKIKSIRG
ncbi:MAG: peptidoglycan bridge formation glycyltransferase FemA/FemB family protein [Candidatus Berkelbacteria bacterium]